MPVAIALRSVPIVTTAPLVVLLLGRGAISTIVLVAIMVFFPTFVACLHGLRQAPGQILDVFDSYAAGRLQQLLRVRLPAMLPAFFAAARMAVPASVLAVTVVEWLGTGRGIGSLMAMSASLSDYDMLWSAVVIVSVLSRPRLRRRGCRGAAGAAHLRAGAARVRAAAFAIPGDITTLTGGYIYERRLLEGLRAAGRDVLHIRLAGVVPRPVARRHGRRGGGTRGARSRAAPDPRWARLRLHRHARSRDGPRAHRGDDPPPARA